MNHPDLFEQSAKENGMASACKGHEAEIDACRDMAIKLLSIKKEITIDHLRYAMPGMKFDNWSGSIFKCDLFFSTGYTNATHPGSHGRIIKKWSLKQ